MKFIRNSPTGKIVVLFFIWRLFIYLIAYLSPSVIPTFGATFPYYDQVLTISHFPSFIWSQANFDGVHYIIIARQGYLNEFTQAFFPLFPILIKIGAIVAGKTHLVVGIFLSNIAFLFGLILFFKLIRENFNEKTAFWSCLFLLAFPTSFFFGSVYTESLFFLLTVSAFYLLDKGKIWQASIIGAFASATRLVGVFLAPALYFRNRKNIIPLLIVPLGLISYMIYLQLDFGKPFYFLTAQTIWGQERSASEIILLPQVIWRYLKILFTTSGLAFTNAAFELFMTLAAIFILILSTKKIKIDWLIFSWLIILTPTLTGTLVSMPRYVLLAFPIYVSLALVKSSKIKIVILLISSIMLSISVTLFSRGYWVA